MSIAPEKKLDHITVEPEKMSAALEASHKSQDDNNLLARDTRLSQASYERQSSAQVLSRTINSMSNAALTHVQLPSTQVDDRSSHTARESEQGDAKKKQSVGLFKAFRYANKTEWIIISVSWIFSLGTGILLPLNFVVLGDAFGELQSMDMSIFRKMMKNFVILGAVCFVCQLIATFLLEIAAERQLRRVKQLYIKSVLSQEVGYFDIKDCGTLAGEVEAASVQVRNGIGTKCSLLAKTLSTFIGAYAVGLWKGWRMTLVLTAVIPVLVLSVAVMIYSVQKFTTLSRQAYEQAGSIAEEALPAARTVAAFNLESAFANRYDQEIDKSLGNDLQNSRIKAVSFGVIMFIIFASYALGWWYGSSRIVASDVESDGLAGLTSVGSVLTVFFAIMTGSFSLGLVSSPLSLLSTAAKAAVDMDEIISRESLIDPGVTTGEKRNQLKGEIEFKNVRFAYPNQPKRDIYTDVSFTMKAGQRVALVGPSGCGKSTVIQLIERFYDPTGGQIRIDDVDHRLYNLQWLRSQMSLVSQEPKLFCDTIYKNIHYGRKSATRDQIIEAAKQANAHNFIMQLPQGYETNVGLGGSLLSGGQKQRIAIARAILRDPSILILDEATSALDNHSERIVQDALDKLLISRQRTTIIIAHRLTTIRGADKIIVLDNRDSVGSTVVEAGTHDELMSLRNGLYKALVTAQSMQAGEAITDEEREDFEDYQKQQMGHRLSVELTNPAVKASREMSMRNMPPAVRQEIVTELRGKARVDKLPKSSAIHKYMGRDRSVNWIGTFFAAGVGVCFPFMVVLVSKFLQTLTTYDLNASSEANADSIRKDSSRLSLLFLLLGLIVGLGSFAQELSFGWTAERLVARLRRMIFRNTIHQDAEFFDNPRYNTGFLSSVMSADCELAKTVIGQNISVHVQTIFQLITAVIIAFIADARVAAVAASLYFIAIPSGFVQAKLTKPITPDPNAIHEEASAAFVMNEVVTNLKTVAAYGLQEEFMDQYCSALDRNLAKGTSNSYITACASALAESIPFFASAVSFWYAGTRLTDGTLDVESMMKSAMAIMVSGQRVSHLAEFTSDSKKARLAVSNIILLIERKPKMDSRDSEGAKTEIKGKIDLEHVKFRYPGRPSTPILSDVSFTCRPGMTVALVGESGGGKSTVMQFLERFYDVEASQTFRLAIREHNDAADPLGLERLPSSADMFGGTVKVDDRSVQSYNLVHLRSSIGHVGQEPVLFDMSIRENIRNGKPDATDDEIQAAAKAANAHDFIMALAQGYDTEVGKGGGKLSGGQKQRIAIARAIVRDPKILLLDEATSALDPESEEVVQKALDKLMHESKRTTVVIAHRLSTIKNADKIVVFGLEPGLGSRIVESGTHDELIRLPKGVYRHLVDLVSSK